MSVTERDLLRYEPGFYVTGGTLPHDAPCYIRRKADDELYDGIRRGELCYLLTSRQMGKSSLMVRTAARLRAEGTSVVVLDLTMVGRSLTLEQWYRGLLSRIGDQLDLEAELDGFWREHSFLGPLQRWMAAVRWVVLARSRAPLVVFIDELDVIRGLPFPTDEFIAAIRACYNQRAQDPDMERLSFCLLGVATPAQLVSDVRTTPFNIGRRIELNDFTALEAAPLAQGLSEDPIIGRQILNRVLYWTGGHPYLTQRLCQAVVDEPANILPGDVDRLCARIFFCSRSHETDDNLAFVRQRLLKSESDLTAVLELYSRVIRGTKPVRDDETNSLVSTLRLSGVVRVSESRLRVSNRIYAFVFDKAWVNANMPNAEIRRQRIAYRTGLARATAVWVIVVAVVGTLGVNSAIWARRADEGKLNARRFVYISQIGLAQRVLEIGDVGRAAELVNSQIPVDGEEDLRGFEWSFLRRLCQNNSLATIRTYSAAPIDPLSAVAADGYHTNCAALSPDGKTIAVAVNDGIVKLIDVGSRREVGSIRSNEDRIQSIAFSPKGDCLAVGGWDGLIKLLRVSNGEVIGILRGHSDVVTSVQFSPDGKTIASGSIDTTVKIWDVASQKVVSMLRGKKTGVVSLAFSPTGKSVAVGYGDTTVRVWEIASHEKTREIGEHKDSVGGVFAFGGKTIAVGPWEKLVKLGRGIGKRESHIMATHSLPVVCVAYSPDGTKLATGGEDGIVRLWSADGKLALGALHGQKDAIVCIRFAPDGRSLATGIWDGATKLWDVAKKREVAAFREHRGEVTSLSFSRDGTTLITSSWDGTIKLWDARPKRESISLGNGAGAILSVTCSSTRKLIAAGCEKNVVKVWSARTARQVALLTGHSDPVFCVAFSPDGRILASGSGDEFVRLWDTITWKEVAFFHEHKGAVLSLAWSPDGNTIASAGADGALNLWNVSLRRTTATMPWQLYPVTSIAFSPNGNQLATGCIDGRVTLWSLRDLQKPVTLSEHSGGITSVSFSPHGETLATASYDGTVRLWDVETRTKISVLTGHRGWAQSLAFSPDGKTLATGSDDTSVKLWNIATRQEMLTLQGHNKAVRSVCFAPDGGLLATAADDGMVRLWPRDDMVGRQP